MTNRIGVAAALSCLLASGCAAQAEYSQRLALPKPDRTVQADVTGKLAKLENGLRLFVVPDPNAGLVEFDVRHHVGSRDDPHGKEGLAHYVEHLMFEVAAHGEGSESIMVDATRTAVTFNAYTSADETHYQHLGVPEELESYVRYTAARLQFDCEALSDEVLAREREVVRNELRFRAGRAAFDAIVSAAFEPSHPYHHAFASDEASIASFTREDVCGFVQKFYSPTTTDIVVTGDVQPAEVLALINAHLGELPGRPVKRVELAEAALDGHTRKVEAPVAEPVGVLLYALPRAGTTGSTKMKIATAVMEPLVNGTLQMQRRRKKDTRAKAIEMFSIELREAPLLAVTVTPEDGVSIQDALDEARALIDEAATTKWSPRLYDLPRQQYRRLILQRVASTLQSADAYADALETMRFYGDDLAIIDDLEPGDVQAGGRRYLSKGRAMKLVLVPDSKVRGPEHVRKLGTLAPEETMTPMDISAEEASRPLPHAGLASPVEFETFTLANGLDVYMVRTSALPVLSIQLLVKAGMHEADDPLVAALTPSAYDADMENVEGRRAVYSMFTSGADLSSEVGPHATRFSADGLSIYLDFVVAGLAMRTADAVLHPNALHEKKTALEDLFRDGDVSRVLTSVSRLPDALWGKGHPNTLALQEHRGRFRSLRANRFHEFHDTFYRADNSTLIITGGFDEALMRRYVEAYFGPRKMDQAITNRWQRPSEPRAAIDVPPPKPGSTRVFTAIDEGVSQLDVSMRFPLAITDGPDRAALSVLVELLDLEVGRVRREKGAAYSMDARLDDSAPSIVIEGQVDGRRAAEAVAGLMEAIDAVRGAQDFDRRFAFARRKVYARSLTTQRDATLLASALARALSVGMRAQDVFALPQKVAGLEREEVRGLIDRVLSHERSVTVLSGTQASIDAAISAYAWGPSLPLFEEK